MSEICDSHKTNTPQTYDDLTEYDALLQIIYPKVDKVDKNELKLQKSTAWKLNMQFNSATLIQKHDTLTLFKLFRTPIAPP